MKWRLGLWLAVVGGVCSAAAPAPELTLFDISEDATLPLVARASTELTLVPERGAEVAVPAFVIGAEAFPGVTIDCRSLPDRDFSVYSAVELELSTPLGKAFGGKLEVRSAAGESCWINLPPDGIEGAERQVLSIPLDSVRFDRREIAEVTLFHPWPKRPIDYVLYRVRLTGEPFAEQLEEAAGLAGGIAAADGLTEELRREADRYRELLQEAGRQLEPATAEDAHRLLNTFAAWKLENSDRYYPAICDPALRRPETEPAPKVIRGMDGRTLKLVWSEEFASGEVPDPTVWSYEEGFVRNQEQQYYMAGRPENVRIEDGCLVIESRREELPLPPDAKISPWGGPWPDRIAYTSGSIQSKNRAYWGRGRIEVRAMLPGVRGSWPAIWLLGNNIDAVGYPACGEIDIMENVGYEPERIYGTVHIAGTPEPQQLASYGESIVVDKPHLTFHCYAIEWDENGLALAVDGRVYMRYSATQAGSASGGTPWPFTPDQPVFLLLNTAIGGAWGGSRGIDDDAFPCRFLVDYVRVYE